MRIAFIGLKGLPTTWTGIEFHVGRLGRGLVARGHEVTAYTRTIYTEPGVEDDHGIRLIRLPTIRSKHLDASVHSFLAAVHASARNFDVIHFHGIGPGLFSLLPRLFGRRVVCTVHRLDWQADKWRLPARRALRVAEFVAVRAAHRTIVVSEALQSWVKDRHGRDAVYVPNGIDPAAVREPSLIHDRYGLHGRDYILFLGRLSPEKRVHWLIRTFKELPSDNPHGKSLRLVIAGGHNATDDYVTRLHEAAAGDPRIIFTGFVSGAEKEELLSNALVFVLPSRVEGLPIALLEAKSYGLCCVASDIAPHREMLTYGADGALFDADDAGDLTRQLQALLNEPETIRSLGDSAGRRMARFVGWDEVVTRTEAVYRDLVRDAGK